MRPLNPFAMTRGRSQEIGPVWTDCTRRCNHWRTGAVSDNPDIGSACMANAGPPSVDHPNVAVWRHDPAIEKQTESMCTGVRRHASADARTRFSLP
ncbi:hypothetical protein F01_400058 [Burkholderia cenocepacia]|nr:hypothetical protein F01_400058 [Burkholderia cenocepacia]